MVHIDRQSRSGEKIGESDERNTHSIVSSDVCFHGLRNLPASLANRILPWDFSFSHPPSPRNALPATIAFSGSPNPEYRNAILQ